MIEIKRSSNSKKITDPVVYSGDYRTKCISHYGDPLKTLFASQVCLL